MITEIDASLLEKIADLTGKPVGAFNIRKDMGCEARQSTEHISIDPRADGKPGTAYLVINNSKTDTTTVSLPTDAEVYQLSAEALRSGTMLCNCKPLVLGEDNSLPEITPITAPAGELTLPAATCTFIVL